MSCRRHANTLHTPQNKAFTTHDSHTLNPNKYRIHTRRDGSAGKWDRNLYLKDPHKNWLGMTAHL